MKMRGFTLIELLVVITIIGVLSTIGLTSFQGANQKARDSRRAADVQQIRAALEMYKTDKGYYPTTLSDASMPSYFAEKKVPTDPRVKDGWGYVYEAQPASCTGAGCIGYSIVFTREAVPTGEDAAVTIGNP